MLVQGRGEADWDEPAEEYSEVEEGLMMSESHSLPVPLFTVAWFWSSSEVGYRIDGKW